MQKLSKISDICYHTYYVSLSVVDMGNAVNLFSSSVEEVRLMEENKILKLQVERLTI